MLHSAKNSLLYSAVEFIFLRQEFLDLFFSFTQNIYQIKLVSKQYVYINVIYAFAGNGGKLSVMSYMGVGTKLLRHCINA